MIDSWLEGEDWLEPHSDMNLEAPYGRILAEVAELAGGLAAAEAAAAEEARGGGPVLTAEGAEAARALLVRAPAIVNVLLNYKICAEHGLPFHPTVYYELAESRRYRYPHSIAEVEGANRLFRASIALARAAYALEPDIAARVADFTAGLPPGLADFVYTSEMDKYTWRGTEPAKVRKLAGLIEAAGKPDLIIGAAHGSIMPALLLANDLDLPLYFLRFSMFKRKDEAPIVSLADEAWLSAWSRGYALLFDEDVAGGSTLTKFRDRLSPLFATSRTACVIRHAGASIRPDFVGRVWYD